MVIIVIITFTILLILSIIITVNVSRNSCNINLNNRINKIKNEQKVNKFENKNIKKEKTYNIPLNVFKFSEGSKVCSLYNSKFASRKDIEKAYKEGDSWCNYGWVSSGEALYPAQKSTILALSYDKDKVKCLGEGINGGRFYHLENPKFGVNCVGEPPKPEILDKEMKELKKRLIKGEEPLEALKKIRD